MDIGDILGPWILLMMLVLPLLYVEKFIHQHIYGVGYLITKDKEKATTFYYLIFFPGVFLHEIIQYFVAGILNVPIKKLEPRPQKQDNGTLRFDFVTIQKTDKWRAAIIGGTPFLVACLIMWTISISFLDLHLIPEAFATGEITEIARTINDLRNTPDFWLLIYLLFTISNGMIPTKEDRQGWWFILAAVGAISAFFLVLGLDNVIVETYQGPVMDGLAMVNTALAILLFIDILAVLLLGVTEDTLERIRGEKMDYSGSKPKEIKRQAGSDLPIPVGEPMPSVYTLALPVPDLPPLGKIVRPSTVPAQPTSKEETKPAGAPTPPARQPATTPPAQPTRKPAPALASNEPTLERVADPDAALRAQMDPLVPRTSGDSPFKRSNLPQEEATPAAKTTPPGPRQPDPARSTPLPSRSAPSRPETKAEPTKEPAIPTSGGGRFARPTEAKEDVAEPTQSMSTTQRIRPEEKLTETDTPPRRFQRDQAEDKQTDEPAPSSPASRFGRQPSAEEKSTETDAPPRRAQRDQVEDKQVDKPAPSSPASRFGRQPTAEDKATETGTPPSRFQRDQVEDKQVDEPAPSSPASRFGRQPTAEDKTPETGAPPSRFQRDQVEDKQADQPAPSSPASRFGRRPDDKAETTDASIDKPAKPSGRFARPSASTAEPTQTMQTTGRFRPNEPSKVEDAEEVEEKEEEPAKPAKPSGRFSRPRRERERPTTPPSNRFGRRSSAIEDTPNEDDQNGDDVEYVDFDDI